MTIIHICGASGSGKTTIGEMLARRLRKGVAVIDLDDLLFKFVREQEESKESRKAIQDQWIFRYQALIDETIHRYFSVNLLIFVGLNSSIGSFNFRGSKFQPPDHFYDLRADHKIYIDLPEEQILRQKFYRSVTKLAERKERYFDSNQDDLFYMVDIKRWTLENRKCERLYKKYNYKFVERDKIFDTIGKFK